MISENIDKVIFLLRYLRTFKEGYFRSPSNYEVWQDGLPKATMFSDSIILSCELDNWDDFTIFAESLAELQSGLLEHGILLRGGVELGDLYHEDMYIFGEGLLAAYFLENEAVVPRILVGEKLIEELNQEFDRHIEDHFRWNGTYEGVDFEPSGESILSTETGISPVTKQEKNYTYINYIRYALNGINPYYIKSNDDWLKHIDLAEIDYTESITYIKKAIEEGLKIGDDHIRAKYEWLKDRYNGTLKMFLDQSRGEYKKKFIDIWSQRYIK